MTNKNHFDKWVTTDGYDVEDIVAKGRCIICGRIGVDSVTVLGTRVSVCGGAICRDKVASLPENG